MNLYTADLHFGHDLVIGFDQRPFANVDIMDDTLIDLWNRKVNEDDHVYILGDFAYRNKKSEEWYLSQLKGHKHLIVGNHDTKLLKNSVAMSYFDTVEKMMHVSDNGVHICLCHFPLAEWNGYYKKHLHMYGHIHNERSDTWEFMKTRSNAYNVGCMLHGYSPMSLNEIVRNCSVKE